MLVPYNHRLRNRRLRRTTFDSAALVGAGSAALGAGRNVYKYYRGRNKPSYVDRPISFSTREPKQINNPTFKRRRKRGAGRRRPKTKDQKQDAQIRKLKLLAESNMGTYTGRLRNVTRLIANENTCGFTTTNLNTITNIETELSRLRYYDVTRSGSVLTNIQGATGSYQKEFLIEKVHGKLTIRNNYQAPLECRAAIYGPKGDTAITPLVAFTAGLADIGNPSATSALVYATDSEQLKDLWTVKASKTSFLDPGEELIISYTTPSFQYDPSLADSHAFAYQKDFHGLATLVRIMGRPSHDTVEDQQGAIGVAVDIWSDTTTVVRYAAGADIKCLVVNDNSDASTNFMVCSHKPVPDNIAYSVI